MRPLILSLMLCGTGLPAVAAECGSIVPSVCVLTLGARAPTRKVLTVQPVATPFIVGDRFPVEGHSLLMDPTRYGLQPSDGTWRYYALRGVVYRVETGSDIVLEAIRSRRTAHLR